MKLAIVTTHPIQYNAPWFKLLAQHPDVDVKVFYTWEQTQQSAKHDPDFGRVIEWDIPLLDGYEYTFVKNIAASPGSSHFKGIDNPTLNDEIKAWGAESVLVFGWAFKSHLACMKYFKGRIPVLFRGDSTLLDEQPGIKRLMRKVFLHYVYRYVDYALYVGTNNKDYFLNCGLRESQLVFVPHAIDNKRFEGDGVTFQEKALLKRAELGIDKDDFVVLFAGKFIEKKDPDFLLKLASEIKAPDFKFLLVGNGKLEYELKSQAKADSRVKFLDFQNQEMIPVIYHMSDVFVLPSKGPNETWGLAINEAMACGKPVVTTNKVGCAVDMIKNKKNGIVIAPGDYITTAAFVQGLHDSGGEAKLDLFSINENILSVFSFDNMIASITALLSQIKVKGLK